MSGSKGSANEAPVRVLAVTTRLDRPESQLLIGLARAGVALEVICDPKSPYISDLTSAGVAVSLLSLDSRLDYAAVRAISWKVRKLNIQVVHAFSNRALSNIIFATYGMKVKRIAYRGTVGNVSRLNPGSWLNYLNPGVDRIVCVSEAVKQYFQTLKLPEKKLVTIYKGHDTAWYPKPPRNILEEFGFPLESFIVGCAANMRPLKGIDVLIRAAEYIKGPVQFLLIGEVRDKNIFRLVERSSASIHLTGYRPDATMLLGACDLAVMPSLRREGLPKAMIEAMAQAVPAVVTDVGGMPELVRDGKDGLVVPPGDPIALAKAIEAIMMNPIRCLEMGKSAREQIETVFSLNRTVNKTLALYRQVLSEDSTRGNDYSLVS